jgi:hypothetical protein
MSSVVKIVRRIAWLVGDRAINEFEIPLVRSLGFEVYQSPHAPLDRAVHGHRSTDAVEEQTTLPPAERAALDAHDFYEHEMTPNVAAILNRRFDALVCSCHGRAIREIATYFRGRIIIRATAADRSGFASYGERLHRGGGATLLNLFREASQRLWFAPLDDILPEKEDPFLRSRLIRLPTGIPERTSQKMHSWIRDSDRILAFQMESGSKLGGARTALKDLLGDLPAVVAGQRPKAENDGCAAAFLPSNVLERWPWSFGEGISAAGDDGRFPHHPFEAILKGMPTVFLRDAYIDRLGAADLPGACTCLRDVRQKLRRILNGDLQLIELIRASQSVFLSTVNPSTTRSIWSREFVEGIMAAPVEPPPQPLVRERSSNTRRLAVVMPGALAGTKLRTALDLVKMLQLGARTHETGIDVVVSAPVALHQELAELAEHGVQIRPLRWKTIRGEAQAIAELVSSGIAMKLEHAVYAQPVDGGNDLLDCDTWLVVGDEVPAPLLPIRPYGALLFDMPQRYVPELFDDDHRRHQAQTSIPFARNAKYVLVATPSALADVNAYAGVPRRKIQQSPLFFELPPVCAAPSLFHEGYFVWHVDDDFNNLQNTLEGLVRYFARVEKPLNGVVMAPRARPADRDVSKSDTPRVTVDAIRDAISAEPELRGRLRFPASETKHDRGRIVRHARFVLHANVHGGGSLSAVDAAAQGVRTLSARYPAMEFVNQSCGLAMAFFDPRDPDDLARGLAELTSLETAARLPDRAFLDAFHWRHAAADVCSLVFSHLNCLPTVAYR